MKNPKISSIIRTLAVAAAIALSAYTVSMASDGSIISTDGVGKYFADRIIITIKNDASSLIIGENRSGVAVSGSESLDLLCEHYGVSEIEPFYPGKIHNQALRETISRIYIFIFAEAPNLSSAIADFSSNPDVECADLYIIPEPFFTPNDPEIAQQWYLATTHAYQAWDTVRGDTTRHAIIGIVDTGVYWDHPDLAANIWINEAEDANHDGIFDSGDNDGIDADSNGYIDDVVGWDMGQSDNNPAENTPTHGTAVAGAASEVTDNGIDGAAIGYDARLMVVKGSNQAGQLTMVYQGMVYAADNGANIINCSWGSYSYNQSYQNIINNIYRDGVFIVAAAGVSSDTAHSYPGGYDNVLAVGGCDSLDTVNTHGTWVDIFAPSDDILTTWGQSSMDILSGNSFASPMTCGLAALIKCWNPNYGPDEIEETIKNSADSIGYLNPELPTAIRLNCERWLLPADAHETVQAPREFSLLQNYPNPFNAQTEIRFVLASESDVNITLFDIAGRMLLQYPCGMLSAGFHGIKVDGKGLASGIYFYRVQAGAFTATKKCLLLK